MVTKDEKDQAKERLGISPETFVIGYCGRLAPEKRVDVLIDAVSKLEKSIERSCKVVIAGDGWKRENLEAQVEELGLRDRVVFAGWIADSRVAQAAFDVAVLPSLMEGFPLGLMESMALGSVNIAHAEMPSALKLINPGDNGVLVDMSKPSSIALALADIMTWAEEDCLRMGRNAARTIEENHSRQNCLPAVLKALDVNGIDRGMAGLVQKSRALEFKKPMA